MNFVDNLLNSARELANNHYLLACLILFSLPFLEAIIPAIPLIIIATAMVEILGFFMGFVLLSSSAILGSLFVFWLVRKVFRDFFINKIENSKYSKFRHWVSNVNEASLIILLTFPFTPSSIVNYSLALSDMKLSKVIRITVISKLLLCLVLVFLGTSLLDLREDPLKFSLSIVLLVALILISKKLNKRLED